MLSPETTFNAPILSSLLSRAISGNSPIDGLALEFINDRIVVSAEGRRADVETLAAHWGTYHGDAVTVKSDVHVDYDGGEHTCLWVNIKRAIANG